VADQDDRVLGLGDGLAGRRGVTLQGDGRVLDDEDLKALLRQELVDRTPARGVDEGAVHEHDRHRLLGGEAALAAAEAARAAIIPARARFIVFSIVRPGPGRALAKWIVHRRSSQGLCVVKLGQKPHSLLMQ
jgi:hypothetical protein